MSLSNPRLNNPCTKFIEFKGDKGIFQYWDKTQEKNIEVPMPLKFIFLDELNTVTGFSDTWQNGIFSNEVHNLNTQVLNVKVFKSPVSITGLYKDIKGEILSIGGKFKKSIYIALFNENNEMELANLSLKGSGFGGWLDKKFNPEQTPAITVTECIEGKKGAVTYKIPVFKPFEITPSFLTKAMQLDKQLQDYLKVYENQKIEAEIEQGYEKEPIQVNGLPPEPEKKVNEDDLPF